MKRIIIIEGESEELVNRFADACEKKIDTFPYLGEILLQHFKGD